LRQFTWLLTADHQSAHDAVSREQWYRQERAEAGAHDDVENRGRIILDVRYLDRRPPLYGPTDCCLAEADMTIPDRGDDRVVHSVGRAQSELLAVLVEYIVGASLRVGELRSLGYNCGQDGFKIDARIHRLADLAERPQFTNRLAEFTRARLHLVEQPYVLDRDHRLVGKGSHQLNLFVGEWPHLRTC